VERVQQDSILSRNGGFKRNQLHLQAATHVSVTSMHSTATAASCSLKVTHCSDVLPGVSHDHSEQLKKMLRGKAQLALAHVRLHDPLDAARLVVDEFGQVSAPKMASHQ
jgi:hypothetical protein